MNSVQYVSGGAGPAQPASGRRQAVPVSRDKRAPSRYDSVQIALHWATAILVVALYSLAQVWGFFAKATTNELVEVHISLGVLLAGMVLARIFWRLSFGRRLPAVEAGMMGLAAKLGHLGLYLLLIAVVGLGFWMHWAAAGQLSFFGLFAIPSPFLINRDIAHALLPLHFWAATVLIIMAAGHAAMALFHHYVLRDGTLKRMLPLIPRRTNQNRWIQSRKPSDMMVHG